jgi:hypothetical protein
MRAADVLVPAAVGVVLMMAAAGAQAGPGPAGLTRGERNRNPGNIRRSSSKWVGLSATQTDTAYAQFDRPLDGIRAIAVLLRNYGRNGFDSVGAIVRRWAPSSENDTAAYIANVSRWTGYAPDRQLDLARPDVMRNLVRSIIRQENGRVIYDDATINAAVAAAGIR